MPATAMIGFKLGLMLLSPLQEPFPPIDVLAAQACAEGRPVYVIRVGKIRERKQSISSSVFHEQRADARILKTIVRPGAETQAISKVVSQRYVAGPPPENRPLRENSTWLIAVPPRGRISNQKIDMVEWRFWTEEKQSRDASAKEGYVETSFDGLVADVQRSCMEMSIDHAGKASNSP